MLPLLLPKPVVHPVLLTILINGLLLQSNLCLCVHDLFAGLYVLYMNEIHAQTHIVSLVVSLTIYISHSHTSLTHKQITQMQITPSCR